MRVESSKDEIICQNIEDVIATYPKQQLEHKLFGNVFTGCDRTSQIHNFMKISIFRKLKVSSDFQEICKKFYTNKNKVGKIGNATIPFFELLHSPSFTIQKIMNQKYDVKVASDRCCSASSISQSCIFFGLRFYQQIVV